MQTTRSSGAITPSSTQFLAPGDAGGAGRLAAEAARADLGLGVEHLLVGHLADHAVAALQGPQAFGRFTGRLISMALAMRRRPAGCAASSSA